MKLRLLLAITVFCSALLGRVNAEQKAEVFPKSDLMKIGVYYYPEAWSQSQWERDIATMKSLNLEFVHMGEFAWAFMEPEEGKFDFSWLDKAVDLCAKQGMKVVLCTPSPTPPVWLVQKHPEILMVDNKGRKMMHGSRQQATWSSDVYRHYVGRIVDELGKHYGNNPAVWGWQLDNELSHYGKEPDYSDASQSKFRLWLKQKYQTIDALNSAWGASFWSQMYQDFDQIRIPNADELVAQVNPNALLDSQRWFADETADYLRFQATTLRKHCGTRQWITTNYMQLFSPADPARSAKDLELISWTHYPVHGDLNEGPLGFRLGSPATSSFYHDYTRSLNGNEGEMELQPGQVNWGDVNSQPYPGAIHLWLMRAFAAGSKLTCSYRFREVLSGSELYHYGFVGTDGVTPTTGGLQYKQAAEEMQLLRKHYTEPTKMPAAYAARKTGMVYSIDSRWDVDNHKQSVRWNTINHALRYYRALKSMGAPVDVITEDKDFNVYPFLVVTADQVVDLDLVARWKSYAEQGGHLVITCRTAQKDRQGHLWEAPWAGPILDLIGAKIKFYDMLPSPYKAHVSFKGTEYPWYSWGESLDPNKSTEVLVRYTDQYYQGDPAAVTRKLGKGTVTYVGVDSADGKLENALMREVFNCASVPVENLAEGFYIDWRDGFWVATNFNENTQTVPGNSTGRNYLIGSQVVPIAGVSVWQDK
jgi:beta-galactosidase